ncbi:autotransporter outer membrane beta-barrel domain-containing protein [Paenochrobactrum glaciei]|uniref:Autotransporter domain-containing protein n=1 Tax=Paenochrobactrum glaciei TaxID=486407 RepID=A0ABP3RCB8_9HYPH
MIINRNLLNISLLVLLSSTSLVLAAGNGGGSGSVGPNGEIVGGRGGGADVYGGSGGSTVGHPAPAVPTDGSGGRGSTSALPQFPAGGGGRGGKPTIINNETDELPGPLDFSANGNPGAQGESAAGGGGAVSVIINASTYTLTRPIRGGLGGYGAKNDPIEGNAGLVGSGGGGVGVVFNGDVLNIPEHSGVEGGLGGTTVNGGSLDRSPLVSAGGGGLGLLINKGTVNNAGHILGGAAGSTFDGSLGAQAGAGVYMRSGTVLNNSGRISVAFNSANFSTQPAVIMAGDGIVFNNKENGKVYTGFNATTKYDPFIVVEGNSNIIVHEGIISGGPFLEGFGELTDEANTPMVSFDGDNNTLELRGGNKITGLVSATGGKNHLVFGGAKDDSFDISKLGIEGATQQYTGFSDYKKTGSSHWTLLGAQGDSAPWKLEEGVLSVMGSIAGTMHAVNGRLEGAGSVGSLTHEAGSTVAPGQKGIGVLTVNGDYIGNAGNVEISAVLGGDDSQASRLIVKGNSSGSANVHVINRDGLGAHTVEGINIIEVGGQSDATFTLEGNAVTKDGQSSIVVGAYSYTLHKNGLADPNDGNWYLRSSLGQPDNPVNPVNPDNPVNPVNPVNPHVSPNPPRYNPGAPVYEGYLHSMQALNRLPTLQQRVGERYWKGASNPIIEQGADAIVGEPFIPEAQSGPLIDNGGIWGRVEGSYEHFEARVSTSGMAQNVNSLILQAGLDGQFYEGETGKLIGGFTAQYGTARSSVISDHGDGKIDTQGWGLGTTLTWYADNGFYLDGQAQLMRYDSNLYSTTTSRSLLEDSKGFGYSASLEAGKRIYVDSHWSLTPQMQFIWSSVDFDSFNDAWGASVSKGNGNSLRGRLGISANYSNGWYASNGMVSRSDIYTIVNLYQEFMKAPKVAVAGLNFEHNNEKTWGGIGAGGTYMWADNKYALYGEGSVNTSLKNFAKSYNVKGTLGFKIKW